MPIPDNAYIIPFFGYDSHGKVIRGMVVQISCRNSLGNAFLGMDGNDAA